MSTPVSERDRLLALVADYCLQHGVADLRLRRVAEHVGSNNRMLLYYFGSKEEMIEAALLRAVDRFPLVATAVDPIDDHTVDVADRLSDCWRRLTHPDNTPFLRLFFEVFGLAVHRPGAYAGYLDSVGHAFAERVSAALVTDGVPARLARGLAREVVALWRGLQFDLLSNDDRAGVDACAELASDSLAQRIREAMNQSVQDQVTGTKHT